MGKLKFELPNESFFIEIEGDTPTIKEQIAINELLSTKMGSSPRVAKAAAENAASSQISEQFDTERGIQNSKLRAALSLAEKSSEEDLTMERYGFASEDYTRDPRGRLAVTPSGAAKMGIETDKSILIDEEGFSGYDIADLAGIGPELALSVYGTVKGATLGAPLGPGGILIGGALGAATGGASGNLAEEAIEGVMGVSDQSAEDIAIDTGKEALIAGAAELTFGAPFAIFKAFKPKAGVIEEGGEAFESVGEAVSAGYQPTKSQMGMSPIASKLEQVFESVLGVSPRQVKNQTKMKNDLANFRQIINQGGSADEAGQLLLDARVLASQSLKDAEQEVQASVMGQLDDAVKSLTGGLRQNRKLDDQLFVNLEDSFRAFDEANTLKFGLIDNVLNQSIGEAKILPTNDLKDLAESFRKKYGQVAIGGTDQGAKQMADALSAQIDELGNTASFSTLYRNRENLAKAMYAAPKKFGTEYQMQKDVLAAIDNILTSSNIEALGKGITKKFGSESIDALKAAADSIPEARRFYNKGMKRFEDIEAAVGSKNLVAALRQGTRPADLGGFGMALVKNGNKKPLLNMKAAVDNPAQYNQLKKAISREWLRTTLKNSGFDSLDPTKFNSEHFLKAIDDLGETGEELFGSQINGIRSVAQRMDNLSIGRVDQSILDEALEAGIDQSAIIGLRNALNAAESFAAVRKPQLLRKLADGTLEPDEALEVFLAKNAKKKELRAIMDFYKKSGNENAITTIRAAVLDDLLQDVGTTVNAKKLSDLSARITKADGKGGANRLDILLGDPKIAEDVRSFGRIMGTLSKDASTSDLVAAGMTVNFMNSLGRIARISIFGRIFDGSGAVKQIDEAYKRSKGMPVEERANLIGSVVSGLFRPLPQATAQLLQEGASNVTRETEALSKRLTDRVTQQATPNMASGIGSVDVTQPLTPDVAPMQANAPVIGTNVPIGARGTPGAAVTNLRQMATNNPEIARALGIRGATAGLL